MSDTPAKRNREAKKRRAQEVKNERKRLRKEGLLGQDNRGLFAPGETPRECITPPTEASIAREERAKNPPPPPPPQPTGDPRFLKFLK